MSTRHRIAALFTVTPERRRALVDGLPFSADREAATYWLQLGLSIGMATFGLALDSAAVIIGAMLVSPLMSPIIDLSLSLLVGASAPLVRSLARVITSVGVVLLTSFVITRWLPFHEPTEQILARVSPTALDLIVASCCAIAAALTVTRPGSSAASTAAGTAIGISLVPPLCAAGFGLGIGDRHIAEGAFLLFIANFCAIQVFASIFFWLVGFDPMRPDQLPATASSSSTLGRVADLIGRGLSSRHGMAWRTGVPLVLFGAVLVPLSRALSEVTWQVNVRTNIQRVIRQHAQLQDALNLTSTAERGVISLRATIVGTDEEAAELSRRVSDEIMVAAGVIPSVRIKAVPKADDALKLEPARRQAVMAAQEASSELRQALLTAVKEVWPPSAGELLGERLTLTGDAASPVTVEVAHTGAPLDAAATHLLARLVSERLSLNAMLRTYPVPAEPWVWSNDTHEAWIAMAVALRQAAAIVPQGRVCVARPDHSRAAATTRGRDATIEALLAAWQPVEGDRLVVADGGAKHREWTVWLGRGTCD